MDDDNHKEEDPNLLSLTDNYFNSPVSVDTSTIPVDSTTNVGLNSAIEYTAAEIALSPFAVISNNAPTFRYKYPEAKPTPPDEDDTVWNRTFTAADSRLYNKNGKNAANSKKFRLSGETRALALQVLAENKRKYFAALAQNKASPSTSSSQTSSGTESAVQSTQSPRPLSLLPTSKGLSTSSSHDSISFSETPQMSISEKVKAEGGRNRKAASTPLKLNQNKIASTRIPSSSGLSITKADKESTKNLTTASTRKPGPKPGSKANSKYSKQEDRSTLLDAGYSSKVIGPSDSESNDGGEYCICRGPDDHRIMVNCEGPCKDWYHCSCLGIDVEDAKELLDRYVCPKCSSDDFFTTYKPMCRYHNISGCRKAAQIGLKPNPSMYCSEEHRRDFWKYVAERLQSGDPSDVLRILDHTDVSSLSKFCNNRSEWLALGNEPKLELPNGMSDEHKVGLDYVTPEEVERIEWIHAQKILLKNKIELVHAQKQLLIMIHEYCKKITSHPKLEVKDFCGYDNRLAMNEAQFLRWKDTEEGKRAFETGVIRPRARETTTSSFATLDETMMASTNLDSSNNTSIATSGMVADELQNVCLKPRKKCKHNGWRDIHCGDYQLTISNYEEDIARLQGEEDEIIKEAEIREATKDYHAHNVTIQHF